MKNTATFNIQGVAASPPMRYKDFDATELRVRTGYNGEVQEYPVVAWGKNQGILRAICAGQSVYIAGFVKSRTTDKGIFIDLRATEAYVEPEAPQQAARSTSAGIFNGRRETQPQRAQQRQRIHEETDEDFPF